MPVQLARVARGRNRQGLQLRCAMSARKGQRATHQRSTVLVRASTTGAGKTGLANANHAKVNLGLNALAMLEC